MRRHTAYVILFTGLFLLASCNAPRQDKGSEQHAGDSLAAGTKDEGAAAPADPLFLKLAGSNGSLGVSAGKAAGILQLKAPSDTLHTLLGKADSTAADMCKDLSAWTSGEGDLRIYSLCDNDLDMRKSMQVIAISGFPFTTASGVSGQSTFAEIKQRYPGLRVLGKVNRQAQTFFVADDVKQGIAFELSDTTSDGRCLGVLVHLPGKDVISTNIPLYPGFKRL